jgi:drug/metabolite transporter (DMT)-like permease
VNPWTPLVAATIGWGSSSVITRFVILRGVDTWTLIPIRMSVALVTLFIVMATTRRFRTTNPKAWRRGIVLGTLAMSFPMILMTLALEDLPVSLAGFLIALIPLSTIAAAHFLVDGERFRIRVLPGLLIALVGCGLLVGVGGGNIEGVGNLWRGVSLISGGVVLAGIGGALTRRFAMEVSSDQLVLPQFVVNTIVVVGVAPLLFPFDLATVDSLSWVWLIVLGAVGTTLPFAAFLVGAAMNPASRLALTGYSVPVVAVALAVIFLGERLTAAIVAGAVLIVVGVIMSERASDYVPEEPGILVPE